MAAYVSPLTIYFAEYNPYRGLLSPSALPCPRFYQMVVKVSGEVLREIYVSDRIAQQFMDHWHKLEARGFSQKRIDEELLFLANGLKDQATAALHPTLRDLL